MADGNKQIKVWRQFERKNKDGIVKKFRIQNMPEDNIDELIKFMCINYIHEENLMSTAGVGNDSLATREFQVHLGNVLDIDLSLVCCLDNDGNYEDVTRKEIVAASLLFLSKKDEFPVFEIPNSEPGVKVMTFLLEVAKDETIYEIYNIDKYLNDEGLSVLPEYRGLGLGIELMQVRDEVCRAEGIKISSSYYTGIKSQNLARKCGYETYYERDYTEIGKLVGLKFPDHTKSFKKMAKVID